MISYQSQMEILSRRQIKLASISRVPSIFVKPQTINPWLTKSLQIAKPNDVPAKSTTTATLPSHFSILTDENLMNTLFFDYIET
ncbi:CLUMA_CG006888, isoform A [Clunio marinus]|uniref:CLUMA_CG006888, isoform A n=1 Tax=Clunio marinus TaxID=568069 RepID=A0A1J1HZG2_9DIPT|nr:CLUMA_CG006888, isoform A [Clunio marinus]